MSQPSLTKVYPSLTNGKKRFKIAKVNGNIVSVTELFIK